MTEYARLNAKFLPQMAKYTGNVSHFFATIEILSFLIYDLKFSELKFSCNLSPII